MADLRAEITALLDQAAADGSKVIAIEAIYQTLGESVTPPARHHIVFGAQGWNIRHPAGCNLAACAVFTEAERTLAKSPYAPGRYEAWLGPGGGLAFQEVMAVVVPDSQLDALAASLAATQGWPAEAWDQSLSAADIHTLGRRSA